MGNHLSCATTRVARKGAAMSTATTTAAGTKTSVLDRVALIGTVLAVIVLAVPLAYTGYAALTGNVTLETSDDISNLLRNGLIVTVAALVLGLLAFVFGLLGAIRHKGVGRIVTTVIALVVLVGGAVFLLLGVLPRASAMQTVQDKTAPFATTMRDNCKAPLNQTQKDLFAALIHTTNTLTDDTGFATFMQADAAALDKDATKLANSLTTLNSTTVPDAKYQPLLDDCKASVKATHDFLKDPNSANAIPLPPPFNALAAKIDGVDLLSNSAAAATGKTPLGPLPKGTVEPLVQQALTQAVSTSNPKLTAEGDQLTQDLKDTLTNTMAPFKVDTDKIVG
jgi:uncharacterized membrane protein required for colicin V production